MVNKFLKFLNVDSLLDGVKGYIEAKIELFKLEMQEKAANAIATMVFVVMLAFCFLMMLIFLSVALGNFLNEVLGNTYWGFAVLGLFYLIMVVLLAANISKGFLHKRVRNTIKKSFVKKKP